MCTAINYKTKDHYFGRNLDLEYNYQETVVITPRNFPFKFRRLPDTSRHYAMIGMATVVDDYPLYYEATNEHGLSMAALNFPGNAEYFHPCDGKDNVAPFEMIPWLLGRCKNLDEAMRLLSNLNIAKIQFSSEYPNSPLHWMIAYKNQSVVIEQTKDRLFIYDNPVGILTNNPPFPYHMNHLNDYMHLSPNDPVNLFSGKLQMTHYSRGMGAIGLPGDLSSASRFVRAAFMKENSVTACDELSSVSQFFHLLNSVSMPRGSVVVNGENEITVYSCCCNTDRGIYYYTAYDNSQITAIHLHNEDLNGNALIRFPLIMKADIRSVN